MYIHEQKILLPGTGYSEKSSFLTLGPVTLKKIGRIDLSRGYFKRGQHPLGSVDSSCAAVTKNNLNRRGEI